MLDTNLERSLHFIEQIEAENPDASAYFIANELRRYTRKSYNDLRFAIATLSDREYINNTLDIPAILSRQEIDFAHFIAALCDRIRLPGLASSIDFTTAWTAKHTSWSGDLGQALSDYQNGKFLTLEDALRADASEPDLAANIAASIVGNLINNDSSDRSDRPHSSNHPLKVSQAIRDFDSIRYPEHVRAFIYQELGGTIELNTLTNPQIVEANIRRGIAAFAAFIHLHALGEPIKNLEKYAEQMLTKSEFNAEEYLFLSLYFLRYAIARAELNPLTFRPYQNPYLPLDLPGFRMGKPISV